MGSERGWAVIRDRRDRAANGSNRHRPDASSLPSEHVEPIFLVVAPVPGRMTNFDPGGVLVLLTVIPAVVAGVLSVGLAHLVSWIGYGEYETNVAVILGVLIAGWIAAALVVSTSMLLILSVVLSMIGAYAATRSIQSSSYGWVLGVVLLFVAFAVLSALGIYEGVDRTGVPQGFLAEHLRAAYFGGLLVFGAIAGKAVHVARGWLHGTRGGASGP